MTHKRELLVPIGLLALALLCYASVIPTYFLSDDFCHISRAAREGMLYSWANPGGRFLRPGTDLSYLFDYWLWGLNPVGYHLTNVIFHALAAYAIYLSGRHLFTKARITHPANLSFLTACLFVALSCHSESVSWIAGRTDVIAVAFGLMATACFLFLLERESLLLVMLSLVLLAAALLTKEPVIVLPPIWCMLFGYYWWSEKKLPSRRSVVALVIACILLAGYFLLRKAILGHFVGGYGTALHISILQMSSLTNLIHYLVRTFLPALPIRFNGMGSAPLYFALGFGAVVLVTVLSFRWRQICTQRWHLLVLLVLCYLVSLIPVATMHVALFETQGERFLYLPSAFACLAIAYVLGLSFRHWRFRTLVLLCLILFQAAALQWVNKRWITASILCKQIAGEVSEADPTTTIILNVPDNYRGAYLFRNGLQEAATFFIGNEASPRYRQISSHNLSSLHQFIEAKFTGLDVILKLPDGLRFYKVQENGFDITRQGNFLRVANPEAQRSDSLTFLSFTTGNNRPILRTIKCKLQNGPYGSGS